MFHRMHISFALAAACTLGATVASAQTTGARDASGQTAPGDKVELASYGQNYASACYGTSQLPHAMAYGQSWGGAASNRDCDRFYHYPYVFYPQNFRGNDYYKSSDSLYNRYPPEMQIPVYNKHWHNYYPAGRRYHSGHHFILDVF